MASNSFLSRDLYQDSSISITARSIFDCKVFLDGLTANGNLNKLQYDILCDLHSHLKCGNHNHFFIYLRTSTEVALKRIQSRSQMADELLTPSYMNHLSTAYDSFYESLSPSQKICFDTDEKEFSSIAFQAAQYINSIISTNPYNFYTQF